VSDQEALTLELACHITPRPHTRPAWPRPFIDLSDRIPGVRCQHALLADGAHGAVGALRADERLIVGVRRAGCAFQWRDGALTALTPDPGAWIVGANPQPDGFERFATALRRGDLIILADHPLNPTSLDRLLRTTTDIDAIAEELFGEHPGVGMVLRALVVPDGIGLRAQVEALLRRGFDISYEGNEHAGTIATFAMPWPGGVVEVQEAILTAVRELPAVLPRMRAHIAESDPWTGEAEPGFTSFLDPDGRSGYLYAEPLEAFAEHSEAVRASFLDPGTPLGRAVEVERLSGHAIVDALSTHVERLDVVALHSAPTYDGSVLAIHVLGGRDALTGELVGVVLERVWT